MREKNIPSIDYVAGTITIGWSISEKDLKIDKIQRELTDGDLRALYDRIEDAVTSAIPQTSDLFLDGESELPVRVHLEAGCMCDIEIDDGPINGCIDCLRGKLKN